MKTDLKLEQKNLRPCGCGGTNILAHKFVNEYNKIRYFLACDRCGVQTKAYVSKAKAINAWEKR